MWAFVVWVWVSASQKIPSFWCETYTNGLRAWFPTKPEEDEGRKEGPRREQKKPVKRRKQNVWTKQSTGESKWLLGCIDRRPDWPTWEDESAWWLCGNFVRIHTRDSLQMHGELHKSVTNFSFPVLRANPSPCLFSFLPPSRLCFVCP